MDLFLILFLQVKGNEILLAGLERRKKAIHERRLALEKDVCFILNNKLFYGFSISSSHFMPGCLYGLE